MGVELTKMKKMVGGGSVVVKARVVLVVVEIGSRMEMEVMML